uniref:Dipeptide transport system permease protein DppB n=1 Tax=uncultured Nocardioidaceae bacterium TaxID=253824 RepID=A0A6J4MAK5_9ACTN|nr:MAG: Dipeptide transport system permease protein DppB [uncultured Nocardioidaceae bacterium]
MLRFALRRLALLVPTLIGLSILLFAWVRALPGDPARTLLGQRATPELIAQVNETYGFEDPIVTQYFRYVGAILQGDFGISIRKNEPVLSSFFDKLPATIELTLVALLLAAVIGIPLGYLAARRQGSLLDTAVVSGSLLGVVMPVFFLALLLKYAFAIELGLFATSQREDPRANNEHPTGFYILDGIITGNPGASWDAAMHLVLPAIALGTIPLAIIVRITRAAVSEVVHEDYVRTAEAKGLAPGLINRRHVLRNALLPVVTTVGLQLGLLLSGAVLTETIFAIDGVGGYLFDAIRERDYPVLQGYILFIAIIYSLVNLAVDISYGFIDPRVRVS